ncbi:MAG: deoxyribose-phosphate aldolase [Syntrophomonadaceae bacterium]
MLASYMDSTNLKAEATAEDIRKLCEEAATLHMAAVCVNPYRVAQASGLLKGTGVNVCTVIGFPLGALPPAGKRQEACLALKQGAQELDMVINIGALKDGNYGLIKEEIEQLAGLKQEFPFQLKVIVETALLAHEELVNMVSIVSSSAAQYIKTSTGMAARGASLEDLEVIKQYRRPGLKIKASGGVRELDWALRLIAAGTDRIGSSNAGALVKEYLSRRES